MHLIAQTDLHSRLTICNKKHHATTEGVSSSTSSAIPNLLGTCDDTICRNARYNGNWIKAKNTYEHYILDVLMLNILKYLFFFRCLLAHFLRCYHAKPKTGCDSTRNRVSFIRNFFLAIIHPDFWCYSSIGRLFIIYISYFRDAVFQQVWLRMATILSELTWGKWFTHSLPYIWCFSIIWSKYFSLLMYNL